MTEASSLKDLLLSKIETIGEKIGNRIRDEVKATDLDEQIKVEIWNKLDDIEENFVNECQNEVLNEFVEQNIEKQISEIKRLEKESPFPSTTRLWRPKVGDVDQQYLHLNMPNLLDRKQKLEEIVKAEEHNFSDLKRQVEASRQEIESSVKDLDNLIEKHKKLRGKIIILN